jgi:hypothetical protein
MAEAVLGREHACIADNKVPKVPQPGKRPLHDPAPSRQAQLTLLSMRCPLIRKGRQSVSSTPLGARGWIRRQEGTGAAILAG